MRVRYTLPTVLAIGLMVGCAKPTTSTAVTTPSGSNVELAEVSAAEFENAIGGLRGKVVLVDAWFLG